MARADVADRPPVEAQSREPGLAWLGLLMFATPIIWGVRLVAKFIIASQVCYPDGERLFALPARTSSVWPTLLAIDLVAIAVAVATIMISYRVLRRAIPIAPRKLIQLGKGRTRFVALWGLIIGFTFLGATLYDIAPLLVVPVCG